MNRESLYNCLNNKKSLKFVLPVFLLAFLFFTILFIQFTVDDSFISFRYGKNLIKHGIWNWNNNSILVEAYTSLIYVSLGVLPQLLSIPPAIFFKVLGILFFVLLIIRIYSLGSYYSFILGSSLLIFNWKIYTHMFSGLETILFIYLIFELNLLLISVIQKRTINDKLFWALVLLLPLTRPEGILYSFASFLIYLKYFKKINGVAYLLLFSVIGIAYFTLRALYFEAILPNPVYLKSFLASSYNLVFGNIYYSISYFLIFFLLMLFINDKAYSTIVFLSYFIFLIAYSHSSLMMNYADRFQIQIFLPTILVSLKYLTLANWKLISLPLTFLLIISYHKNLDEIKSVIEYGPRAANSYRKIASILKQYANKEDKLLTTEAGITPYYSDLTSIDAIGLANKTVATKGLSIEYLQMQQPTFIMMTSNVPHPSGILDENKQKLIYQYVKFSEYKAMSSVKFKPDEYIILFCTSGVQNINAIESEFKKLNADYEEVTLHNIVQLKYLDKLN